MTDAPHNVVSLDAYRADRQAARVLDRLDACDLTQRSPIPRRRWRGVWIESRERYVHELDTLERIVDALPPWVRQRLQLLVCDSEVCGYYFAELRADCTQDETTWIAQLLEYAAVLADGGRNGLWVTVGRAPDQPQEAHIDAKLEPFWDGDDVFNDDDEPETWA